MDRETSDLYLTNLCLAAMGQVCDQLGAAFRQPMAASVHRVLSAGSTETPAPFRGPAVVAPFEVSGDEQGRILLLLPLGAAASLADAAMGADEAHAAARDVPARVFVEGWETALRGALGDWGGAFQKGLGKHLSCSVALRLLGVQPWDPAPGAAPPVGNSACVEMEYTAGGRSTEVIACLLGRALADRLVERLAAAKPVDIAIRESGQMTARLMRNVLPRAVVAEAQYALRRSIAQALKENGYEPVEVENGPQAVEAARRSGPEAVVVNVAVPGLDGFAVCEQVRRLPGGGRIAVILCADRTQPEDVIAAKKCGADGCLTIKPFQKDALLSKIATAQALRKYGGG